MEKQNWQAQFKCEVEKQLSVLNKSQESKDSAIETLLDNYYAKVESIREALDKVFKLDWKSKNQWEASIVKMALYLWEYEGRFSFCINILCFLLVLNGHDLSIDRGRNYATSFGDVETVDASTKCKFLVAHGLEVFDEKKNKKLEEFRELRNNIAHYKFILEDDGKIKVYNNKTKNWEEAPILQRHGELMFFAAEMLQILWQCIS